MTNSESEKGRDIATLRDAATTLSGLRDLDLEEMELVARLRSAADALANGATITDLAGKLHIARQVIAVHGGAK